KKFRSSIIRSGDSFIWQ
ncbi:unnamed protein product, partial [Callosobruchus maculatus]